MSVQQGNLFEGEPPKRPYYMCKGCQVPLCTNFKPVSKGTKAKKACFHRWHEMKHLPMPNNITEYCFLRLDL